MTQTDTKTRITGFGFYLDEIEKLIFYIFLENHHQTTDAMTASDNVRVFLDRICLDNGRINYDEADRLLAKDDDCALMGECLTAILNYEFGEELLSCHCSGSTAMNRPCLILSSEKSHDESASAYVQKAAKELLVDFEHVCHHGGRCD